MATLAVLASGSGTNFQAIAEGLRNTKHTIVCLICNRKDAFAFTRAATLGIPAHYVPYTGRSRQETEETMKSILCESKADLVALAGFMKILSPFFIDAFPGKIINIHPSLLPRHPGTNAIQRSFESDDSEMGITIHTVDYGTDTGPVLLQKSIPRRDGARLEEVETEIHRLEHTWYPRVLIELLDSIDRT